MASWSELLEQFQSKDKADAGKWLETELQSHLERISKHRKGAAVIFYASAFLQKLDSIVAITREDMNGFMNALYKTPTENGLTLILHTPGGDPNAVESIVEYLHSKFDYIEVIVPYLAMSGGAMMCLASDRLILGRQSQLGPIDPQLTIGNKSHSARAIKEGFDKAREDIKDDIKLAHLWAPILQNMGPSLVLETDKALSYSEELVKNWLRIRMFKSTENEEERTKKAERIAKYFNAQQINDSDKIHVHGQRIDTSKLKKLGINVELLEKKQTLQNEVLTAYHLMTLIFEMSASLKFIVTNDGKKWIKQERLVQHASDN